MKCEHCNYALWNLRARVCPECGEPFAIADHEFVPASVRFCCPHCNQSYYGTSAKGHLVPPEFECVKCNTHISMEEMIVLPAEGVADRETAPLVVPWIERKQIGFLRGWARTIGWGFTKPSQIGAALRGEQTKGSGFSFVFVTLAITLTLLASPLIAMVAWALISGGGGGMMTMSYMIIPVIAVGVLLLLAMIIGSLLAHGTLRLMGEGAGKSALTTNAISFSFGPCLFAAVPCLGIYTSAIAWVWWIVSSTVALTEAHRTRTWKALVAMVLPALLMPGMIVLAYVGVFASVIGVSAVRSGAIVAQVSQQSQVGSLTMGWRSLSAANSGVGPVHASALLGEPYVDSDMFLNVDSSLIKSEVAVGSLTLAAFDGAGAQLAPEQQAAITEASESLPSDTIAHRLGDYVFTYHGIDQLTAPAALWVVISSPAGATSPPTAQEAVVVGKVDGSSEVIFGKDFPASLAKQNQLRASAGLSPLPLPVLVTHEKPAVASGN